LFACLYHRLEFTIYQGVLGCAGFDAGWLQSVGKAVFAQVTFSGNLIQRIKPDGTEGTCQVAELAPDAFHRSDGYNVIIYP
jgi:hypothetical protein